MNENYSWSANAGRWLGIPVRFHLLLLLFVAAIFGMELTFQQVKTGTAFVTVLVLLVSIVIHELAHLFTIANLGGHVSNVILMPWGGNSSFVLPRTGQARGAVFLAGPFVNGAIFAICSAMLIQSGNAELSALTNPFMPHEFDISPPLWKISLIKIITWINFQLMWVNLIPCYPFDGASIVRSLISAINVDLPKLRVESAIMVMGHAVAFALIGLSWLVRDVSLGPVQPDWLIMLLAGITLLFAARHSFYEETQISDADWDDSSNVEYDSFYDEGSMFDFPTEHQNTAYSQWLVEKQEARLQDEMEIEEEENRLADNILKKMHAGGGLESLSSEERSILDRVSERIRKRRQQGV